jgi:hypothetical protein
MQKVEVGGLQSKAGLRKTNEKQKDWGVARVEEPLPCKCEALSANSSTTLKKMLHKESAF